MTNIAMIGVGAISGIYLENITKTFREIKLVGLCDLIPERAEAGVEKVRKMIEEGADAALPRIYKDMYEAFADPEVDLVLNITRPYEHFEVSKAALLAGKHVYSEKPLGASLEEGQELVRIAREKGLMLGGAPDTFMGAGIQTCRKLIDDGVICDALTGKAFTLPLTDTARQTGLPDASAFCLTQEGASFVGWSLKPDGLKSRALDAGLRMSPRLIFCRKAENIGPGMMTFVAGDCGFPQPPGDTLLFGPARGDGAGGPEQDDFAHEQSLLLMEGGNTVLIAGCAHRGAVNILRTAERLSGRKVTHFIGGLHLAQGVPAGPDYVRALAAALPADCRVWTMHCTGEDYFHTLKSIMGDRIGYLYCGRSVVIQSV